MILVFETILRTVALTALAGIGLSLFRVRSSAVKLAVWRLVLYTSLLMPLATLVPSRRAVVIVRQPAPLTRVMTQLQASPRRPDTIDWRKIAFRSYLLIAGLLALRTALGLLRLRQISSDAEPQPELGPDVFQTSRITVPVACGIRRPVILLPNDWRNWPQETLAAVLAHERSHITERDFLTQSLSKFNRAIYWINPLTWWLDRELARLAEHTSDDAAIHRLGEAPSYASVLLEFAARRSGFVPEAGVAMARPTGIAGRIDRILDGSHHPSQPITRTARVALGALAFAAVFAIGACRMTTVSAQTRAPKASQWNQWILVTPGGISMSGDSSSIARAKSRAASAAASYLWFLRDGKEYLIESPSVLAQIQAWFHPLEELTANQDSLAEEMARLGAEMEALGAQMSRIKVDMPDMKELRAHVQDLNKLTSRDEVSIEELAHRLEEAQALLGDAQARVGDKQAKIGDIQAKLGDKQARLGDQQRRIGEKQSQVAQEAEQKLRSLVDEAIRDGRAKPVH